MTGSTDQVFPSGVATWAAVMIWTICLTMWASGLWVLADVGLNVMGLGSAVLGGLIGAGPLSFLYLTRYSITPTELIMRSGAIRMRVRLTEIANVSSTLSPGINLAMSRESILQVNVRGSRLGYRISPADRTGFLQALAHACPHLELQEQRLTARGHT